MLNVLLEVDVQFPRWKFELGRCNAEGGPGRKGVFIGGCASGEGGGKMTSPYPCASFRTALAYYEVKCRNEVDQCRDFWKENEA